MEGEAALDRPQIATAAGTRYERHCGLSGGRQRVSWLFLLRFSELMVQAACRSGRAWERSSQGSNAQGSSCGRSTAHGEVR